MRQVFPILEFDDENNAIIEPRSTVEKPCVPERCVLCFFKDVIMRLRDSGHARLAMTLTNESGEYPLYETDFEEGSLALFHPGIGAPLVAFLLEELIASGCRKFIACGGAGALSPNLALGTIVVPTRAVRDEGTSYHYLPPGREVSASARGVAAIQKVLDNKGYPYILTKTWTTDAIYRETRSRAALRKADGCTVVEMEAAAMFAVAEFRGVTLASILYCGDDLSNREWDARNWKTHTGREMLVRLAAQACLLL